MILGYWLGFRLKKVPSPLEERVRVRGLLLSKKRKNIGYK